jgi:hypothetical protein
MADECAPKIYQRQFRPECCRLNGCISIYCNFSLAPGFSPVGAGDAAPSRFNGFVAAGVENG